MGACLVRKTLFWPPRWLPGPAHQAMEAVYRSGGKWWYLDSWFQGVPVGVSVGMAPVPGCHTWPPTRRSKAVLYGPGNSEDALSAWPWLLQDAARDNVAYYVVDYIGYGLTGAVRVGQQPRALPSEAGMHHATQVAFNMVATYHESVVVMGYSLGASAALTMATSTSPAALACLRSVVLFAPFCSLGAVVVRCPYSLGCADAFNNLIVAPHVRVPVFIVHGSHDRLVPVRHAVKLTRCIPPGLARLCVLAGKGHCTLLRPDRPPALTAFFQEALDA